MINVPANILIILFGAIGDVCLGLPLAVRIKRAWPSAKIFWAVEPPAKELVANHSAIDEVILFERSGGLKAYINFIREVRALGPYDLVLDLQRHFKSGFTSFLSGAPHRMGFHPKGAREYNWIFNNDYIPPVEHRSAKIKHFQLFGDHLELSPLEPLDFGLRAAAINLRNIQKIFSENNLALPETRMSSTLVGVVVGASWESKKWPVKHYVELIKTIKERLGYSAVIVGGPNEKKIAEEIISQLDLGAGARVGALNMCGQTSLSDLVALCEKLRFVVGPDTGPTHIAAACGCQVVSLWGPTSPKRSAPYRNENYVLQSGIGCSPCYRRVCPGLGGVCMEDLPPKAVLAQLESFLTAT